jgi:hypothetical protein
MYADIVATIAALGSVATAATILIGFKQLRHAQEEATTRFEDDLSREYRAIIAELPVEAFFVEGEVDLTERTLRTFYRYFDLSNEQLFHGALNRVRPATLDQWRDGITGNLALPVFGQAWNLIGPRLPADFFDELRKLEPLGGASSVG